MFCVELAWYEYKNEFIYTKKEINATNLNYAPIVTNISMYEGQCRNMLSFFGV